MTTQALDLKRHLISRVSLFALTVLLVGTLAVLLETRYRVRSDIQRTGETIRQLIGLEVDRSSTAFDRHLLELDLSLSSLNVIGELAHFCVRMTDLYARPGLLRCFPGKAPLSPALADLMAFVIGDDVQYHAPIGQFPGITVGNLTVEPDYGSEWLAIKQKFSQLLIVTALILFMNFLVYRPVRKALAPVDLILHSLDEMEKGNLNIRLPQLPLIEFSRIANGFNHLADQLQKNILHQQHLANKILSIREEERQHLARELHDEFGQYLASINGEAAYALELARESLPPLEPCALSISKTTRHMMETLHQILHRLRPGGLDEFGLLASVEQLLFDWERRCRGKTQFSLRVEGDLNGLSDNINVSLYRIIQEGINNALRHGKASLVAVSFERENEKLTLSVWNNLNSTGFEEIPPENEALASGGFGVLGMEERVLALGGRFSLTNGAGEVSLRVVLSLPEVQVKK